MENCIEWQRACTNGGYGVKVINYVKYYAHRLAYAESRNIPLSDMKDKYVIHLCDNPSCINPEHLKLGTQLDKMADMKQKGRSKRGERHWRSKLTEADVLAIRAAYARGGIYQRELAKRYGVNQQAIGKIVTGQRWAWLK